MLALLLKAKQQEVFYCCE
uniref:Uncharacterized protein n=1 Tax=Anguilla anguilla TaxID=7936 RepID=A0A0E9RWE6_ANGAN